MNVGNWFEKRGLRFVIQRASNLFDRYGITPAKATARIEDSLTVLARFGCSPTFFTPGIVAERYSRLIQGFQAKGAEIAVHSYQHVDLNSLPLAEATEQLSKAIETFNNNGIEARGFRCPYLGYSDELLESLPAGLFGYSSNRAIWLEVPHSHQDKGQSVVFNTLRRFYHPESSAETSCMPSSRSNMIEIPVCVPDDLQLHDGLDLDSEGISQAWIEMLHQTHQRGELFNLIFHPELGSVCRQSFEELLQQAIRLRPAVWITRLRGICEWWREKAGFKVEATQVPAGLRLSFTCSSRATILARGLGPCETGQVWNGAYLRLQSRILDVPADLRPFVGLPSSTPGPVVSFLREQGYIVDTTDTAVGCAIYLDANTLDGLNQVQLVDHIEASPGPLVRYWCWPDGAKSALCITGDLDALTLLDYAARLFDR